MTNLTPSSGQNRTEHGRFRSAPPAAGQAQTRAYLTARLMDLMLLSGLVAVAFQVVKIGPAQPVHLWVLAVAGALVVLRRVEISRFELFAFFIFVSFALILTFFQDYGRVKSMDQAFKFAFMYPLFYIVGRSFGAEYRTRAFPYGFVFLFIALGFEVAVEMIKPPLIYKAIIFASDGSLHGTFIERNWLASFFFLTSYVLWLKDRSTRATLWFVGLVVVSTLLSGSKTAMISLGIALIAHSRYPVWARVIVCVVGLFVYIQLFGGELTGQKLAVKLNQERGLAFQESIRLIDQNWLGYGLGFVEYHFSNISLRIMGLGLGTNSIFASPLDFMLIAGVVGLAFWCIFFLGMGLSATAWVAPIAAWSISNPMHQSEMVYLFLGVIIALAQKRRMPRAPARWREVHRPGQWTSPT